MGRRSLAEQLYEESEEGEEKDGEWLIVYDFESKPNPRLWTNLNLLSSYASGSRLIQHSVYTTSSARVARAVIMLAKHYGAMVESFSGEIMWP